MRTYNRLVLLVMLVMSGIINVHAQSAEAIQAAFAEVIHSQKWSGTQIDTLAFALVERNKKNAEVISAIGMAYYQNDPYDTAHIFKHLELAKKVNPQSITPYMNYGEWYNKFLSTNPDSLMPLMEEAYRKATEIQPYNPKPYITWANRLLDTPYKLAKNDDDEERGKARMHELMNSAIAILNQLQEKVPTSNAELELANIYYQKNEISKAHTLFKAHESELDSAQVATYAMTYFMRGSVLEDKNEKDSANYYYQEGARIVTEALAKCELPDYYTVGLMIASKLKNYDQTYAYYDKLHNLRDTIPSAVLQYVGDSYFAQKNYTQALDIYDLYWGCPDTDASKWDCIRAASRMYDNEFDQAVEFAEYDNAIDLRKTYMFSPFREKLLDNTKGDLSFDYYKIAEAYNTAKDDSLTYFDKSERDAIRLKADEAYGYIQKNFPGWQDVNISLKRFAIHMDIDKESGYVTGGLLPYADRLIEAINNSDDPMKYDSYMASAYKGKTIHYVYTDNYVRAAENAYEGQGYDPNDQFFANVLKYYSKYLPKKKKK